MRSLSISWGVRSLAPLFFLLLSVTGCGSARRSPGEPPPLLIFSNESLDQATVYIAAAGMDFRRVGTVLAGRTDTLEVPVEFARRGSVNIVARLLARSEVPQTGAVALRPGEHYQVRLQVDGRVLSFLPGGT